MRGVFFFYHGDMGTRLSLLLHPCEYVAGTTQYTHSRARLMLGATAPAHLRKQQVQLPMRPPKSGRLRGQSLYLAVVDDWHPTYQESTSTESRLLQHLEYSSPLTQPGFSHTVSLSYLMGPSIDDPDEMLQEVYENVDTHLELSYIAHAHTYLDDLGGDPNMEHGYFIVDPAYIPSTTEFYARYGPGLLGNNTLVTIQGWGEDAAWLSDLGFMEIAWPNVTGRWEGELEVYTLECAFQWRFDLSGVFGVYLA